MKLCNGFSGDSSIIATRRIRLGAAFSGLPAEADTRRGPVEAPRATGNARRIPLEQTHRDQNHDEDDEENNDDAAAPTAAAH